MNRLLIIYNFASLESTISCSESRAKFAVNTNLAINSMEYCCCLFDESDIRPGLRGGSGHGAMTLPLLQTHSRFLIISSASAGYVGVCLSSYAKRQTDVHARLYIAESEDIQSACLAEALNAHLAAHLPWRVVPGNARFAMNC